MSDCNSTRKTCSVDGCDSKQHVKTYCIKHYGRFKRNGHTNRVRKDWIGLGSFNPNGYRQKDGKREHVIVAEKAFGKPLPAGAVVHHVDGNKLNNDPSNLVICQDQAYHRLLHTRENALNRTNGVYWYEKASKWRAYASDNGKSKNLGYFTDKEKAYDARIVYFFGEDFLNGD